MTQQQPEIIGLESQNDETGRTIAVRRIQPPPDQPPPTYLGVSAEFLNIVGNEGKFARFDPESRQLQLNLEGEVLLYQVEPKPLPGAAAAFGAHLIACNAEAAR